MAVPTSRGPKAGPLFIIMIVALLALPCITPAYTITGFSDGTLEETLVFSDDQLSQTVQVSIPRATNLSESALSVSGEASQVADQLFATDFPAAQGANISINGTITLAPVLDWWNTSWAYRLHLELSASVEHNNIVVETDINLSEALGTIGISGDGVDINSIRMVERTQSGSLKVFNGSLAGGAEFLLPTSVQELEGPSGQDSGIIHLKWFVPGMISAAAKRHFEVYLDANDHPNMLSPQIPPDYPEVIYSNSVGGTPTSFLYKNAGGTFNQSIMQNFSVGPSMSATVGDVNSDGYPDILFTAYMEKNYYNGTSRIFYGREGGIDNSTSTGLTAYGAYDAAIADLNNDGYQDIVLACYLNWWEYEIPSVAFYGSAAGESASGLFNGHTDSCSTVLRANQQVHFLYHAFPVGRVMMKESPAWSLTHPKPFVWNPIRNIPHMGTDQILIPGKFLHSFRCI